VKKLLILTLMILLSSIVQAEEPERIKWERTPIAITLPIDKERMIIFPSDVRVNVPSLIRHQLRTISNEGVVYWKADAPFERQRVKVQIIDTGKIIMIDLAASEKRTKVTSVEILVSSKKKLARGESKTENQPSLDYVQLMRFAAQSLYAPERLITTPQGVIRTQLETDNDVDTLIRGQLITASPIVSWQSNGIYVTAVKLQNLTSNKIILDPRDIRGRWEAATFQHVTLGGKGTSRDTTSLYLISKRPYEESM